MCVYIYIYMYIYIYIQIDISLSLSLYLSLPLSLYIYIYTYRERERERYTYVQAAWTAELASSTLPSLPSTAVTGVASAATAASRNGPPGVSSNASSLLSVSVKKTFLSGEPLPCSPEAETALQPLSWLSESSSSHMLFSPEECFFAQTPVRLSALALLIGRAGP